jgi:formate hydrogenlyase subunit 3/multisubunit Na+/H+ antiporter MnhD subunit
MKNIKAFSISAMASIGLVALLTIIGEKFAPLKDALTAISGHHSLSKSIIAVVLFVVLGIIIGYTTKSDNENSGKFMWGVFWTTLGASVAILVYYRVHTFA